MKKNSLLRQKLQQNKPVIGTWCNIPSSFVTDIIASSGLDFLIIDREHGPITFETALQMVVACEANQVSPSLRIGSIHAEDMQKALDIGAHCVHVPNISTVEQAKQCVNIFKYPPIGQRGFSPFTKAGGYGSHPAKELMAHANEGPLLAIHIEDLQAVENLEAILHVSGVDIFFLGLFDLSKSLGIPGEITHPKLLSLVEKMTKTILSHGKYPGTIVTNQSQLKQSLDFGMRYIAYSVDCCMLKKCYQEMIHGTWPKK